MKLTNIQCRNSKFNPEGEGNKLSDGGGLFLHVKEKGKYWRMNYRFLGEQKTLYIGVYPEISLAEAREKRDASKKLIAAGKDPSTEKKIAKIELRVSHDNNFEAIAREWFSQNIHTWSEKHAGNVLKRLERNIFKHIGSRPIKEIRPSELLHAIQSLENEGHRDLAHRMLQHCSKIFLYAISKGIIDDNTADKLKGALQPVKSKDLPFLKEHEMPLFLQALEQYDTEYNGNIITKLGFKLLILTNVRTGELQGAKWEEIDWDKKEWRLPAERMKVKGQPHIVPLAKQAIEILQELHDITGHNISGYVLPSQQSPRKTISENTFLRAIKIMGYKDRTVGHGFRKTFSTIMNENSFNKDAIERQLAHTERNQVRAAYNYAEYLPERTVMMQWYADKIDELRRKNR